jgi:predicted PurR-regulated permease PerM
VTVLAASDYPFLKIFWTILIFFAWVIFIWIAIAVLMDLFRRRDLSGWAKAAWVVLVIVLPFLGVLAYLIFNHDGMAERTGKEAAASQAQLDDYVRQTAGAGGPASEIDKAKTLLESGVINQAEFDAIKTQAIGTATPA